MHAIILAAGEGRRFFSSGVEERPLPAGLSYPIPKCLYPVRDPRSPDSPPRPVLDHLLAAMHAGGLETAHVATGHLGEKVERWLSGSVFNDFATILPPVDGIDYTRGPLLTLAGALARLNERGLFSQQGFDQIVCLCPADLVIDRKAFWYVAGNPARGMMVSRALMHFLVDDRPRERDARAHTTLADLVPERFQGIFPSTALTAPVVPVMAMHVDVLAESVSHVNKGHVRVSTFLRAWIDAAFQNDREFKANVNVIPASNLGSSFYWHDLDDGSVVRDNGL